MLNINKKEDDHAIASWRRLTMKEIPSGGDEPRRDQEPIRLGEHSPDALKIEGYSSDQLSRQLRSGVVKYTVSIGGEAYDIRWTKANTSDLYTTDFFKPSEQIQDDGDRPKGKRILYHPDCGGDPEDGERYFTELGKRFPNHPSLHPLFIGNTLDRGGPPLETDEPDEVNDTQRPPNQDNKYE